MDLDLEEDLNLHRNKDGKYVIDDEYIKEQFKRIGNEIASENKNANLSFILEGLCGIDVSKFDMSNLSQENFIRLTFDSKTKFSQEQIDKFHPERIIEQGKNFPGVESLHEEEINGEGTTIVIMDTCFNSSIEEYKGRVIKHIVIEKNENGEVKCRDYDKEKDVDDRHGATTASLAAGKECGVAPKAKLILFGVKGDGWPNNTIAWKESEEAMLKYIKEEIEKTEDRKFGIPDIISMSAAVKPSGEADKIIKWLNEKGCTLMASNEFWHDFRWGRTSDDGKTVLTDELTKIIFDDDKEYDKDSRVGKLKENKDVALVPCTGRTSVKIGKDGKPVYRYNGSLCGASFAIPQVVGLFARARQIDPSIRYNEFIEIVKNPERLNPEGMMYVEPEEIIKEVKDRSKTKGKHSEERKATQELGSETLEEQGDTGEKLSVEQEISQQIKDLENEQEIGLKGN